MRYQRYWMGLDAGGAQTALCLLDEQGGILFEAVRETRFGPIHDVLRQFGVESVQAIVIEAGVGTQLARNLLKAQLPVRIVDVRKSSKFLAIRRDKTDQNDARGLAEFGLFGGSIRADVFLKPVAHQNIRCNLRIRRCLLTHRKQVDGLIRSIIRLNGGHVKLTTAPGSLAWDVGREIISLRCQGIELPSNLRRLIDIGDDLRCHLAELEKEIRLMAEGIAVCANLQSVPGVGPITALSFYSAIVDPYRFPKNSEVGAYLGLTPRYWQSGSTSRRGRITRFGNKMTRTHLVAAASILLKNCKGESDLKSWGNALELRIGFNKARVAVARKLAIMLLSMWKSGREFVPSFA